VGWIGKPGTGRYQGSLHHWWVAADQICFTKKEIDRGNLLQQWTLRCVIPKLPRELRAGEQFAIQLAGTAEGHGQWPMAIIAGVGGQGVAVDPSRHTAVCSTTEKQKQVTFTVNVAARPPDTITLSVGAMNCPAYVVWTYGKVADAQPEPEPAPRAQPRTVQRTGPVRLPKTIPFPHRVGPYQDNKRAGNEAAVEKRWYTTNCYGAERWYDVPGREAGSYVILSVYFRPRGFGPVTVQRGSCPLMTPWRQGQGGPKRVKEIWGLPGGVVWWKSGEYVRYYSSTHQAIAEIARRGGATMSMQQLYPFAKQVLSQVEQYAEPLKR
jgi:hypothetical protein